MDDDGLYYLNSFLRDAKKTISTQQAGTWIGRATDLIVNSRTGEIADYFDLRGALDSGIDYDLSQHRLDNPDEKFIKMKASSYFRWRETQGFPLDRGNNLSAYMKKFN